ncbi:hypothetical protein ACO2Q8_06145 [Larkinella sp. VNQ87]|uniref:hypothetical protein n=1 Tax=Larkinella sp. VNQ87 TaxID=3400921 RepID=UPI003C035BB4
MHPTFIKLTNWFFVNNTLDPVSSERMCQHYLLTLHFKALEYTHLSGRFLPGQPGKRYRTESTIASA